MASRSGLIFGQPGMLQRNELGAECHIWGASFRMLATHVWKAHDLWADEYRALFGLSAGRGLIGRQTQDRLHAIAVQHLVPHHDAALELLHTRTFQERSASTQGRQLRLETRLDDNYQQALRGRAERQRVRQHVLMRDPAQAERVRQRLRNRGPTQIRCGERGTPSGHRKMQESLPDALMPNPFQPLSAVRCQSAIGGRAWPRSRRSALVGPGPPRPCTHPGRTPTLLAPTADRGAARETSHPWLAAPRTGCRGHRW